MTAALPLASPAARTLAALVFVLALTFADGADVEVSLPSGTVVVGSDSDPRFVGDGRVESFLGIKYASVPRRFGRSVVLGEGDYSRRRQPYVDASDFGPYCWQARQVRS